MHMFPVIKMHLSAVEGMQSPLLPAAAGPRVNPQHPPMDQRGWGSEAAAWTLEHRHAAGDPQVGHGAGTALFIFTLEFSWGILNVLFQIYI